MQSSEVPLIKDVVLVGGGHAHVSVLRSFGMRAMPGVRLTLITRDIHTPYSGMLPGYIAGHYGYDDCHIDLGPLARFAGARLYHAEVERLDLAAKQVFAAGRPPISYDLLSINTGSRPAIDNIPGAAQHVMPVKPIDDWLRHWEALQQRVLNTPGQFRIAVVGGGAGGIEMALSTQFYLHRLLDQNGDDPPRIQFAVVTEDRQILGTHNPGVRRRFERVLHQRGIALHTSHRVTGVTEESLTIEAGGSLPADAVLWATHASAPRWPAQAGLEVDEGGFIKVNRHLQSLSHPEVFAAGDVASLSEMRPKSGVFAVRQGPVLTENLRRACVGRKLIRYKPQRKFLGLISTGDRYAVASRGNWSLEGRWLWTLKDLIDRRFMDRFNVLPEMSVDEQPQWPQGLLDARERDSLPAVALRCGGCGAKVGRTVLERVMERLPAATGSGLLIGLDAPDDATVQRVPEGKVLVQSVDYFRAFIDDPFLFGQIAANHALGDLFAMGADAWTALAIATVPYGREKIVEATLFDLLSGAIRQLEQSGAVLAGGHSSEGAELAFGLSANGLAAPDHLLRKSGLRPGDALILTKPIGTGTLLAADMRRRAKGRWIDSAIESMLVSSRNAAHCLRHFGVRACTDITGFGLAGHLLEMLRPGELGARLELDAIPVLEGAIQTAAMGILSTLQPQNLRSQLALLNCESAAQHPVYPLLFDPQTAGGLLAGVAADDAESCVAALHTSGYVRAAVIGMVTESAADGAHITVR